LRKKGSADCCRDDGASTSSTPRDLPHPIELEFVFGDKARSRGRTTTSDTNLVIFLLESRCENRSDTRSSSSRIELFTTRIETFNLLGAGETVGRSRRLVSGTVDDRVETVRTARVTTRGLGRCALVDCQCDLLVRKHSRREVEKRGDSRRRRKKDQNLVHIHCILVREYPDPSFQVGRDRLGFPFRGSRREVKLVRAVLPLD
jgi:hypothetical protein